MPATTGSRCTVSVRKGACRRDWESCEDNGWRWRRRRWWRRWWWRRWWWRRWWWRRWWGTTGSYKRHLSHGVQDPGRRQSGARLKLLQRRLSRGAEHAIGAAEHRDADSNELPLHHLHVFTTTSALQQHFTRRCRRRWSRNRSSRRGKWGDEGCSIRQDRCGTSVNRSRNTEAMRPLECPDRRRRRRAIHPVGAASQRHSDRQKLLLHATHSVTASTALQERRRRYHSQNSRRRNVKRAVDSQPALRLISLHRGLSPGTEDSVNTAWDDDARPHEQALQSLHRWRTVATLGKRWLVSRDTVMGHCGHG